MERRKTNRTTHQAMDANILDIGDIIKEIWRRKFLTATLIAVPTVLGALYLMAQPSIYRSTSTIILEENEVKLSDAVQAVPGMKFDSTTSETQTNVLRSPTLMRDVIVNLGLSLDDDNNLVSASRTKQGETKPAAEKTPEKEASIDHAVLARYAQGLEVAPVKGSRVITISFLSEDPYLSAEIAKAHAERYIDSRIQLKHEQAKNLNEWIAGNVEGLKKQSSEKSLAVQKFRQENNMIKGRNQEELINQQVSDIAAQLVPVQARKADLQAQADAIAATKGQVPLATIENSSLIQGLKSQAASARQELHVLGAKYGKNHPLYVEAQRRYSQIEGDIARETRSIKQTVTSQLETVQAQEDILNVQLDGLKKEADLQRQKQIELEGLELEALASTKLLDSFIARYEEVSSQIDFATPDARIVSNAEIPMFSQGGKKSLKLVVILFLSTVFACAVSYLLSFADRGVKSVAETRKLLQFRFLGALPDVRDPVLEIANGARSAYFEEIKRIFLHISNKPGIKTILLTAAETGEGKTSLTLALASYLSSLGRKVLVIDADLHTPDVARLSGIEDGAGLADVLTGKVIASTAIRRDQRGVAILPAGNMTGTVDLLSSDNIHALLDGLKPNYDFILVDAAPVLNSSDAEIVARAVDMTIMVVAYAKTSRKNLKKAAETLRQFASDVPSVILNKADLKNVA